MNNIAFRRIFTITAEKVARLELFLKSKLTEEYNEFIQLCLDSLDSLKEELLANSELVTASFEDLPLPADKAKTAISTIKSCLNGFMEIHTLLNHLPKNDVPSEIFILLDDTLKSHISHHMVLPAQDYTIDLDSRGCSAIFSGTKDSLPLFIPTVEIHNPLYWCVTFKSVFNNPAIEETISSICEKADLPADITGKVKKFLEELAGDIFGSRIMGPAYFAMMSDFQLSSGILNNEKLTELRVKQDILSDIIYKTDLNQKIANYTKALEELLVDKTCYITGHYPFIKSATEMLSQKIDTILEKRFVFDSADMAKSIAAATRLEDEVFISSSYPLEISDIRKLYEKACEENNENFDIYEHLNRLKEVPNSSKQIINAGWLYKEKMTDKVVMEMLHAEEPFDVLCAHLQKLNELLSKSIEISNIHKVLLKED